MLVNYFLMKPVMWILPWILQAIGYYPILGKIDGLDRRTCVIPFLAERQLNRALMPHMRTFYRPFVVSAILVAAAYYLDPGVGVGRTYMIIAFIIYGIYLMRLYWRLRKSFGKGFGFFVGLILLTPIFLIILGAGKSVYTPLTFKPVKARLNGKENIILNIEWDAVDEGEEALKGHVTGYTKENPDILEGILYSKGEMDLEAGDKIEFLFDKYDNEGNLIKTVVRGDKVRVSKESRLEVEDLPLQSEGYIEFGGVLTDMYQRIMTTEMIHVDAAE